MSNIIAERILTLRRNANERQEDLAKALNCNRGTIANYEKGARTPDAETLAQIAKHYNTTTDYIVGLSDVTTSNITVKEICDYTGLCEETINVLHIRQKATNEFSASEEETELHKICNKAIQDYIPAFSDYINKYQNALKEKKKLLATGISEINGNGKTSNKTFFSLNKCTDALNLTLFKLQEFGKEFARRYDKKLIDEIEEMEIEYDRILFESQLD